MPRLFSKKKISLCQEPSWRLSTKTFFQKKISLCRELGSLCRELGQAALGKVAVSRNGYFSLPRARFWLSANPLPRARWIALGKDLFADKRCAEGPLPRVAPGKAFAESRSLAEPPRLWAKPLDTVVCLAGVDIIILVLINFNANDSKLLRWAPYMLREIDSSKW